MDSYQHWHTTPPILMVVCVCSGLFIFLVHLILVKLQKQDVDRAQTGAVQHIIPETDHALQEKEPERYRPFKDTYHITMALQADNPSQLISIDQNYRPRLQLRKRIIAEKKKTVHGHVDSGVDAVRELYSYLLGVYLPQRYPHYFRLSPNKASVANLVMGESHLLNAPSEPDEALKVLGTSVEEDLFLLKPTPDKGHQCVAFVCCFPSGWDPADKLGKHLNRIHTGVPSYEKIGPSMERFFTNLQEGKSVKRTNWTVQTHGDLFVAEGNHINSDDAIEEETIDIDKTYIRVELQTLSRLPKSWSILFSFKTYLYPIKQIKEEGLGAQVADAIEGLKRGNAPGMWTYKGAARWGRSACEYLRSSESAQSVLSHIEEKSMGP